MRATKFGSLGSAPRPCLPRPLSRFVPLCAFRSREEMVPFAVANCALTEVRSSFAAASYRVRLVRVVARVDTTLLSAAVASTKFATASTISVCRFVLFGWFSAPWPTTAFSLSSWWAKVKSVLNRSHVHSPSGRRFHTLRS